MWLSGLHIPESFLTALVQIACRKNNWPLDRSTLFTTVTNYADPDDVEERPESVGFCFCIEISKALRNTFIFHQKLFGNVTSKLFFYPADNLFFNLLNPIFSFSSSWIFAFNRNSRAWCNNLMSDKKGLLRTRSFPWGRQMEPEKSMPGEVITESACWAATNLICSADWSSSTQVTSEFSDIF